MKKQKTRDISEDPPLFKKWRSWYILVLANLAGLIILFYIFTKIFE